MATIGNSAGRSARGSDKSGGQRTTIKSGPKSRSPVSASHTGSRVEPSHTHEHEHEAGLKSAARKTAKKVVTKASATKASAAKAGAVRNLSKIKPKSKSKSR